MRRFRNLGDLIRRELCQHFGQDPRAADGFLLRTWRSGPQAGQPKLPPAGKLGPAFTYTPEIGNAMRSAAPFGRPFSSRL